MSFPKNEKELAEQGYKFKNEGQCRGCKADIEWWETPKGKLMPLNSATLEPHWSNCPNVKEFRR